MRKTLTVSAWLALALCVVAAPVKIVGPESSWYVPPAFALCDAADDGTSYFEFNSQLSLCCFTCMKSSEDIFDGGFRQLGVGAFLSRTTSSFGYHVNHVVGVCSEEQMSNVDTRRIVAMVQDTNLVRDRAVGELPCDAMRPNESLFERGEAVAMIVKFSLPGNTPVGKGDADVRLEAVREAQSVPLAVATSGTKTCRSLTQSARQDEKDGVTDFAVPADSDRMV
jgi:hypothetical protein